MHKQKEYRELPSVGFVKAITSSGVTKAIFFFLIIQLKTVFGCRGSLECLGDGCLRVSPSLNRSNNNEQEHLLSSLTLLTLRPLTSHYNRVVDSQPPRKRSALVARDQ
eukprot:scaffold268_cov210-Ochromonas_danica.AAC.28